MDKDEMKNRISMALKDPILQQGFEIICKENEELKKDYEETEELLDKQIGETYKLFEENKELEMTVGTLRSFSNEQATCIERLKEENAKLKDGIALKDEEVSCVETDFNTFKSKVKELLKFWVNDFYDNSSNSIKYEKRHNVLVETEQFLKL